MVGSKTEGLTTRKMLRALLVASAYTAAAYTLPAAATCHAHRRRAGAVVAEEVNAAPIESYDDAEARGFELFRAGEHDRAIRMFELAQTLPGQGVDLKRVKQGGMIGSATAPPNPREWAEDRFATAEQKLIAQYNIACCYAAMGDKRAAIELLRTYASKVGEPLNQVNEMLLDEDLISVRDELRQLREEYKVRAAPRRSLATAERVGCRACACAFAGRIQAGRRPLWLCGLQEPAQGDQRRARRRVEGLNSVLRLRAHLGM